MAIKKPKKIKKKKPRKLTLRGIGGHSPGTTVPRRTIAHGSARRWKTEETTTTTTTTTTT